jgi:hypothetical protein
LQEDLGLDQADDEDNGLWNMDFYGFVSKEASRVGVWIVPPKCASKIYSLKLDFEYTNNVVEYEALYLGPNTLKGF